MNPSPTASAHRVGGRVFTRFFADTSVSALVAGFVAMMTVRSC
jgi:benzoate membrane transport protein